MQVNVGGKRLFSAVDISGLRSQCVDICRVSHVPCVDTLEINGLTYVLFTHLKNESKTHLSQLSQAVVFTFQHFFELSQPQTVASGELAFTDLFSLSDFSDTLCLIRYLTTLSC